MSSIPTKKIGIAGTGAIGAAVARALIKGIEGCELVAVSDLKQNPEIKAPYVSFQELAKISDLVIEALPPGAVPALAEAVFKENKNLLLISSCALLMFPGIMELQRPSESRIIVPSGALAGLDGVSALKQMGIKSARIASTKPPRGYTGAPYVLEKNIDLNEIKTKVRLFKGNALEAAQGFPANVNVAATLSLAGIGPEKTQVEIWADPMAKGNSHEIKVVGEFSTIRAKVENTPDPANPKSSMLAAQSVVSILKKMSEPIAVF
jgi:aspartate dehydrogenase